jgi:CHAT domain-containing protein
VPHGALHYLPFSALTANNGKYALDEYQMRILPSASVMRFLNTRSKNKRYMLALGNPDLNQSEMDLPGAQTEVETIKGTQPDIDAFYRKGASETLIKQSSSQYQRLHIASHGVFYADRPMQSSLLLAKDDSNDGHLTVSEIYDLDLNADLVTLSACETGLGKINNGDDVIGLNRGFLYAGANTIISSLWQVSDAATADLMQRFYQNNGKDKRAALHSAQLSVKKNYPHPYYWAAFQMTGSVN